MHTLVVLFGFIFMCVNAGEEVIASQGEVIHVFSIVHSLHHTYSYFKVVHSLSTHYEI